MTGAVPQETTVPVLGRGVRLRQNRADGSWVLLAPEKMFELDQVSAEILRRVDGERSLGVIVDDLAAAFDAPREEILRDVSAFLQDFAAKRVVDL
ncbi:MAG: pyrroloquinoline quinone biosynthesis peptide chaperone PqqD [Pseudomonadota bacterium]